MSFSRAVLMLLCISLSSAVHVLTRLPLQCSQQVLGCTVITSNCMDRGWLVSHNYTPSGPENLQVSWDIKEDQTGQLFTVLVANWTIKDEGSIFYLKATELQVLVESTNQNLCVRYSFKDKLGMRNPSGKKWSFSAAMVVLDPGQNYSISVVNIPKPEMGHSTYDVRGLVAVPDCRHPEIKMTQFCKERGSLWEPNITLNVITAVRRKSTVVVSFSPHHLCEKYLVILRCFIPTHSESHTLHKVNQTTQDVTFNIDQWPKSCCIFEAEINPFFQQCGNDCTRERKTLNICTANPTNTPDVSFHTYTFAAFGVLLTFVVTAAVICVICRKPGKNKVVDDLGVGIPVQQPNRHPTVLVIYSHDHYLYRDIVLKLCAFLQAKCGTKVLVDLLDSTSVNMVGRVGWLERQRQQLKNPSDKILVLCSQGVQAKWRAICGHDRVTLKEDLLSPTDDMLTPFLNLFLPDMHQAGTLGKYVVAYFDDISTEEDVPSVFDIAVKYKLMKHFEELYFRIAGIEKYQPGQVNHIKGIGGEEYFNCPSGRALKNAIEAFQAYQLKNPDWFEKECVNSEEEIMATNNLLIDQLQYPPAFQCVPLIKNGLPIYIHEVDMPENTNSVLELTPEVNLENQLSLMAEVIAVNHDCKQQYPSNLDQVLSNVLIPSPQSVYTAKPIFIKPQKPSQNQLSLEKELFGQIPTDDDEEDSLLPMRQLSTQSDLRSPVIQNTLNCSCSYIHSEYLPPPEINHFQPVEMEEEGVLEPSEKGQSSGSDQGYSSKVSSQHESPFKEDPLVALAKLQKELFQQDLRYSGLGPDD
ncbi:interleukin 17 receptor A1a isoform X1 [Betta splendens]|uniref:Interleukin 17 receptor A1a isoform X1 n=1 Tax=Betta splendens TaxID=158456 RepID=A0A6P7NAM8_BETSP|nr:interleukin 17 receptor A1a isoform X1 [Betta splendens]